jgi:hypothetical protein
LSGFFFTLFGQVLSVVSWDTALALKLQEDSPDSADPAERALGAVSQGEAGADVIVQGALIALTVLGIVRKKFYGYVAGMAQAVIWIYVTLLVTFQRVTFFTWGLSPDLSRAAHVAPLMVLFALVPGVLVLIALTANRGYFDPR